MQPFRSGFNGASSSRAATTRTETAEAMARRQLTPPESPSSLGLGEAEGQLAQYESFLDKEADNRNVLEDDTDRTRLPADIPLLVLSPKEYTLLCECRSFVEGLVEKRCRVEAEEYGAGRRNAAEALVATSDPGIHGTEQ